MFIERLEKWRDRVLSQEANTAKEQGKLPEAISRAERFSRLHWNITKVESVIYASLLVVSGTPIPVGLTFLPAASTHMLLDGFNDMRIKYLKRAQFEQEVGEYSRLIPQPLQKI